MPDVLPVIDYSAASRAAVVSSLRRAARMEFWAMGRDEESALHELLGRAADLLLAERRAALEDAMSEIGWPEILAFQAALARGQDVREDAGGFFARCLRFLFGAPVADEIVTYRAAAQALIDAATRADDASPDAPA